MRVPTLFALFLGAATLLGCSSGTEGENDGESGAVADGDHDGHTHGGWWCPEHGVPEDECALCKTSLVASFKEQGDWCEKHDRPESQCFLCDPSRFDAFAARYEAKYGEQPPKPEEIAEAE